MAAACQSLTLSNQDLLMEKKWMINMDFQDADDYHRDMDDHHQDADDHHQDVDDHHQGVRHLQISMLCLSLRL